jgi:hypothetical protein
VGYTLELWAGSVDEIVGELRSPTNDGDALARAGVPDEVRRRWEQDAAVVAAALAAGGAVLDEEQSVHVGFVVRLAGHHYGALAHSSSGGDEFRRRFLPGPAARRFGFDAMAHLVNRPLAGLSWSAFPVIGWLDRAELREAAAASRSEPWVDPDDDEDAEPLSTLDRAIGRASDLGLDLFGVYW